MDVKSSVIDCTDSENWMSELALKNCFTTLCKYSCKFTAVEMSVKANERKIQLFPVMPISIRLNGLLKQCSESFKQMSGAPLEKILAKYLKYHFLLSKIAWELFKSIFV